MIFFKCLIYYIKYLFNSLSYLLNYSGPYLLYKISYILDDDDDDLKFNDASTRWVICV